jgi:RNA polymerase sigma-70 factor (ECF subfamily)
MQPKTHREEMIEAMSSPTLRKQLVRSISYGRAIAIDEAEDAVQDAFVHALQTKRPWDGQSSIRTWFTRVAINAMRMRLRSRARLDRHESSIEYSTEAFEKRSDFSALERACALQQLKVLEHLILAELKPIERTALLLVIANPECGGTRRTARRLGLEETAFKSRVFRARKQLRAASRDYSELNLEMKRV